MKSPLLRSCSSAETARTTAFRAGSIPVADDERCTRCEVLPSAAPCESGTLHLGLPVAFVLRKARSIVASRGWTFSEQRDIISVAVPGDSLPTYCRELDAAFTPVERESIRALFVSSDHVPGLADFLAADSLKRVSARANAGMLLDTLADHLTCAFQPIADAQTMDIFAYEALLRTDARAAIRTPDVIFRIARDAGLLPHTDLAARRTIIARAATYGIEKRLFINFCPSSIYDPKSCLRSTIEALDAAGIARERVVFEVVESDEITEPDFLLDILRTYRQAGFKVALDDLGSGFSSLNLLHTLRPDFVKLDIALVAGIDHDPFKAMLAGKIIEAARGLDMTVIAEGIETAGELQWLRDNGAHLLQGFYIARPADVPIEQIVTSRAAIAV
jgi:EAL domain-containing protein (putative c-di-GMP-specific phosphodiesterase class I)